VTKHTKGRKQYLEAPLHIQSRRVSSPLSDDLKAKYDIDAARARKDDTVRIMRGEFKGIEGKITTVHAREGRVSVEGVTREKLKGGTIPIKIHASKVRVTSLSLSDKLRKAKIEGEAS
jgi:large subunit ribosomal protein L24